MPRIDSIQIRRGTATEATANNDVLLIGEMGYETDTLKFKFGDGVTAWNSLAYAGSAGASQDLESVIAQDPIATSSPTFQGLVNIGNGAAATIFMLDGSSGCIISSNSGGLQLVHDTAMNLVTPEVFINSNIATSINQTEWNASTNTPTLADADTSVKGVERIVSTAGAQDLGSGSITWGVGDIIGYLNGAYYKKVDNNPIIKEEDISGTRTDQDISTSYAMNWDAYKVFNLTMEATTTLSDTNLPEDDKTKVIELVITGDFALTLPAYWEALPNNDAYDGTVRNHIVVSCINGTTSFEDVIYSLTNLAT